MISIKNLTFKYSEGGSPALSDINMTIPDGDFVGIIGTSGAGKSTLTFALSGIVPHHYSGDFYGSVTVNGLDTVDSRPEQISLHVGSVFQDIDAQMVASVVEDEILFGLENFGVNHDEIKQRINDALQKVGIADLRKRQISSLSGGQKQKVAVAAIIALKPDIIVLDEPTGELDPKSSRQLFEVLKELNEISGITVVVVEQKIMLLCEFVKHLAVIDGGELKYFDEVRKVLENAAELEKIGINIPRIVTLSNLLKAENAAVSEPPVNISEAVTMVEEALR